MANESDVKVVISAVDNATATIGKVTAALGSLYGGYKLVEQAIASAAEQEDAEVRLAAAIHKVSDTLAVQAAELQRTTKFSDEAVIGAQATIGMYVKSEEQIRQLTAAAADLSAGLGIDLNSAAFMLSKTLNSNMNMLGRYGMHVDGAATSTQRLESIMGQIQGKFGGQAVAQAESFTGVWARMKNQLGELFESFGNVIVRNPAVIFAMKEMAKVFTTLAGEVDKNKLFLRTLVRDGLAYAVEAVGWLIKGVGWLTVGWDSLKVAGDAAINIIAYGLGRLWEAVTFVLKPFDLLMDGLVKLGAIDVNPFESVQEALDQFTDSSKDVFEMHLQQWGKTKEKIDPVADALIAASGRIAAANVQVETSVAASVAAVTTAVTESTYVSTQALTAYLQAQEKYLQNTADMSAEHVAAQEALFSQAWQDRFEKAVSEGASNAELQMMNETMITEHMTMEVVRRKRMQDMAISATRTGLNSLMQYSQIMYQRGGANARKYFSMYKLMAEANAIMDTAASVMGIYKSFSGLGPWGVAAATGLSAMVIALGAAQVQTIRRQSMDGSGGMPAAGGVGTSAVSGGAPLTQPPPTIGGAPTNAPNGVNVVLNVVAPLGKDYTQHDWERIAEMWIMPAIAQNTDRGLVMGEA